MIQTDHARARWIWAAGGINGLLAVVLGAFGAHGLHQLAPGADRSVFDTAVEYHAWHALALLATGFAAERFGGRWLTAAGWLFVAGILLFSGSLYALTLGAPRWLGPVTPVGGLSLLAGWAVLTVGLWRGQAR